MAPFQVLDPAREAATSGSSSGDLVRIMALDGPPPPSWDQFVQQHPHSGPLHHRGWDAVLREVSGVRPCYRMAVDSDGQVLGIMPMYLSNSFFFGKHLATLPDGILAVRPEVADSLLQSGLQVMAKTRSAYLLMRGGDLVAPEPAHRLTVVHSKVDTSRPVNAIWEKIAKKSRQYVRYAQRRDYTFSEEGEAALAEFYPIFAVVQQRLGTPVTPASLFPAMFRHLAGKCRFFAVRCRGTMCAGMICLATGQGWNSAYSAVAPEAMEDRAGYLLFWKVIETMAEEGVRLFDLGRSTPDSGVHLFKQKWSDQEHYIQYSYYGPEAERRRCLEETIREARTFKQTMWRRLPLPVCNFLGPWLRRQLPPF